LIYSALIAHLLLEFEVDNPQSPNTTESSYKQMQH
jgi:hypothetical protein